MKECKTCTRLRQETRGLIHAGLDALAGDKSSYWTKARIITLRRRLARHGVVSKLPPAHRVLSFIDVDQMCDFVCEWAVIAGKVKLRTQLTCPRDEVKK